VGKIFILGGKKLSLENYVLALKDLVGVDALLDAVEIGIKTGLSNFIGNSMKSIYEILIYLCCNL